MFFKKSIFFDISDFFDSRSVFFSMIFRDISFNFVSRFFFQLFSMFFQMFHDVHFVFSKLVFTKFSLQKKMINYEQKMIEIHSELSNFFDFSFLYSSSRIFFVFLFFSSVFLLLKSGLLTNMTVVSSFNKYHCGFTIATAIKKGSRALEKERFATLALLCDC